MDNENKNKDMEDLIKLGIEKLKEGFFIECEIERIGRLIYRIIYVQDIFYLIIFDTKSKREKRIKLDQTDPCASAKYEMCKEITRFIKILEKMRSKFE